MVPRSSKRATAGNSSADLAHVVANWDRLPEAVKAELIAVVEAAGGGDGQTLCRSCR
jgi:hypothetical protein